MAPRVLLVAPLLALLACSSSGTGAPGNATDTGAAGGDTGTPGDDTGADDVALDTAPPTACGNKVGDVLCDLELQGHLRNETSGLATSVPLAPFKTSEALAGGTQPYAFIYTTAFW